jgi:hypothetical protein
VYTALAKYLKSLWCFYDRKTPAIDPKIMSDSEHPLVFDQFLRWAHFGTAAMPCIVIDQEMDE